MILKPKKERVLIFSSTPARVSFRGIIKRGTCFQIILPPLQNNYNNNIKGGRVSLTTMLQSTVVAQMHDLHCNYR